MAELQNHSLSAADPAQMSGGALAFLGDAVLEIMVRQMLVRRGIGNAGKLTGLTRTYVRATAQSEGMERMLPHLTEEEEAVYRRGRNAAGPHPKSATVTEYRRATGFEALFGYLYLKEETERLDQLFRLYMQSAEGEGVSHADEKE